MKNMSKYIFLLFLIPSLCLSLRYQTITHYSGNELVFPKIVWERAYQDVNLTKYFDPYWTVKTSITGNVVFYTDYDKEEGIVLSGIDKCIDWKDYSGLEPKIQYPMGNIEDYDNQYIGLFDKVNFGDFYSALGWNTDSINTPLNSFVLIGSNAQITLYSNINYTGLSICVKNTGREISVKDPDFSKTTGFNFVLRSFHFGCSSTANQTISMNK